MTSEAVMLERVAKLEATNDSMGRELKEVKNGIEKIDGQIDKVRESQASQLKWTIALVFSGLAVTFVLALWLAERISA